MKKLLLPALLALAGTTGAQSRIDWFTIDGGGGAQASANYTVNYTIGQPDVASSAMSSASYSIVPGFWAVENLGPDSGRPGLSIVVSGTNVTLSWPSSSAEFILQQADSLDVLPASWSNTPGIISDNGLLKSITIAHDVAKRFYRLRRN